MTLLLRIIPEDTLTESDDAAIRASLCRCFPRDQETFRQTRAWHGVRPTWSVVVEHDAAVAAHVGIVERAISVGEERLTVAGIQNVLVLPEHRKMGLFRQVMTAAMTEASRRGLDLGLLFCTPDLADKYARLGWRLLEPRIVIRIDENGQLQPLPSKNLTMFHPLRRTDLPPGEIHLQGNDW